MAHRIHLGDFLLSDEYGVKKYRSVCREITSHIGFTTPSTNTDRVTCPDCLRLVGKEEEAALFDLAETDLGGNTNPRGPAGFTMINAIRDLYPKEKLIKL